MHCITITNLKSFRSRDLCARMDDLKAALCLTPIRPVIYKIYTIPFPKVFHMNITEEDFHKVSSISGFITSTAHSLLNVGDVTYLIIGDNKKLNMKHLQAAILQGTCVVNRTCKYLYCYSSTGFTFATSLFSRDR